MTLTRRRFLGSLSFAAAAPWVVSSRVLGQGAPSKTVTLAAIGVGDRGFGNCWHNFAQHADVKFLAVADCFQSRRNKFAAQLNKKYGGELCKAYADYREVLARDDIDGVVVSTHDIWHVPIAYHAALAKKDMYVEKPLGIPMARALKLREACGKHNVIFQYGTQQRSMQSSRIAMNLVKNGYIGKVNRIDVWSPHLDKSNATPVLAAAEQVPEGFDYDRWLGPAPVKPYSAQRVSKWGCWHIYDYALGFIAGWGAHPLDLMQWGMDTDDTSPVSYEGTGYLPPEGQLADTLRSWDVQMVYPNGVPARFMSTDIAKPVVTQYHPAFKGDGTTFHGEEGWVSVSRGACYLNRGGTMVNTSKFEFRDSDTLAYPSDSQARNFIDCIKSRKPTVNPLESAIRSDTISHLSDIAVRLGRKVKWDPAKERVIDDAQAEAMLDRPQRQPWTMG